ncbi:MAG TPA: HAD-IC family P-type ATPase, partial [Ilumatobacteraceae bacterium]|nr:HAD-IC family P-type ATPase [Ilumatobacteraceae bacterium]
MHPMTEHHHAAHDRDEHSDDEHAADGQGGPSARNRHAGHGAHGEVFRRLFWWNLFLAVPVVLTSSMVQDWFGYHLTFWGAGVVAPVLGAVVFIVGGRPFLSGALGEVRERRPGMMLLIAVAISVALIASIASTFGVGDLDFWWELAALIVVMLLGHWLEMRAIGQASGALAALATLLPDQAERVTGPDIEEVAVAVLRLGDVVLVRPGGRIPADGTIVDGEATLDESMITGESRPVHRRVGDRVVAGTVSTDSAVRVRVDAVGADTALAGIQRLVADAQASRSRAQALADRAAAALFYVAMASAVAAMIAWSALGHPSTGIVAVVTVLVIACPHALGLAIPLVIAISTSISARAGILVKDRLALERMRRVNAVLFDKTGTLTRGNHAVVAHTAIAGRDKDDVLRLAAAAEGDSEHPIARAIITAGQS